MSKVRSTWCCARIFGGGAETGNASIAISEVADRGFRQIEVQGVRLDDVADRYGIRNVALVKIDIEGHEDLFFAGARNFLSQTRPPILTEVNNWYYEKRGISIDDAFAASLPGGYRAYLIASDRGRFRLEKIDALSRLVGLYNVLLIHDSRTAEVFSAISAD